MTLTQHDIMKKEFEEFKQKIKDYLKGKFDVRLNQIVEDLNINISELSKIDLIIDQLINEEWIKKSNCLDAIEYDPGRKQEELGII